MLRTGTRKHSNVKIINQKRENLNSFSHCTDEKCGNPEKVGRMASLQFLMSHDFSMTILIFDDFQFSSHCGNPGCRCLPLKPSGLLVLQDQKSMCVLIYSATSGLHSVFLNGQKYTVNL